VEEPWNPSPLSKTLLYSVNINVNVQNQNLVVEDVIKLVRFGLMEYRFVKDKCKSFLTSDIYIEVMEQLAEMGDNSGYFKHVVGEVLKIHQFL
jgi:predicted RNA-binding protein